MLRLARVTVGFLALSPLLPAPLLQAQATSIPGDWREPGGSVIRINMCGPDLCARLVQIRPTAPSLLDDHNPDVSKRTTHLCGLQIGFGFHPIGMDKAEEGLLYDPKSGKTYHGAMKVEGDTLHLRGYVGIKAFGRTEDWTRVADPKPSCS